MYEIFLNGWLVMNILIYGLTVKGREKMAKEVRKRGKQIYRYSICFKEKVVQEVSSGSNINKVRRRYGIKGGSTVQRWIKKFGRQDLLNEIIYVKMKGEKDELKRLQSENQRLKIALGESMLVQHALES
jgi:transposase-like protein